MSTDDVKHPSECNSMEDVRDQIDRIDRELIDLLAHRLGYVDRAWKLKRNPEDATVPWRIEQVIEKVRARAEERELPPRLVEALWRQMIGWFIQYEEERLRAAGGKRDG